MSIPGLERLLIEHRYCSVRIDGVHFCPRNEELAIMRRRKHVDESEISSDRLRTFQGTVRANQNLARRVLFLKVPYMTRESSKADLARTASALPNLRYIDLPDGFFRADPSCQILRNEVQANCRDLRTMTFRRGSEQALVHMLSHNYWRKLERLQLIDLDVDLTTLRKTLCDLPELAFVRLSGLDFDDSLFQLSQDLKPFPIIDDLRFENMPRITSQGLNAYVSRVEQHELFGSLSLINTGATIESLSLVLKNAPYLRHFSIVATVARALPVHDIPPMSSQNLESLNFEIMSPESDNIHATKPSNSYYEYLMTSLQSNKLPSLRRLYVSDSGFAAKFLALSRPAVAGSAQLPLEILSKPGNELVWDGSLYSAGEARESDPVGYAAGDSLAVPAAEEETFPRPTSSYSIKKGTDKGKKSLWR